LSGASKLFDNVQMLL